MDLSIFLAKLFGLYFMIAGVVVMARQKSFMPVMTNVFSSKPLIIILGLCQLFAGLALVLAHPIWTPNWQGVISLIGVWIMVEGLFYVATPYYKVHKITKQFNTPAWYTSGGMLAIVLGAYLAGKGFGLW